ncbi:MAG TPA: alpha/beta hydrolase fold domain-containing protein [Paludibacter sp.]|nr:alpha/beta hydrolase fold domain-containing protein [Paludibacter sp.]
MKKIICVFVFSVIFFGVQGEIKVRNFIYAHRDTCDLSMDVYSRNLDLANKKPCLIYVFGGGFKNGSKSVVNNSDYLRVMSDSGYTVVAIDYRLGMKNSNTKGLKRLNLLKKSIDMAVEDLFDATLFLMKHANELNIDTSKIILCGSSAGAITILQADYELSNRHPIAGVMPEGFRYAAIISFAGGILSYNGEPTYKHAPAPTMFFHGTADKLVRYNKIQVFNRGFFGSNALASQFEKYNYPYFIYRYRDIGHEIAGYPLTRNLNDICMFIDDYVIHHRQLKKDVLVKDPEIKRVYYGNWKFRDMYK